MIVLKLVLLWILLVGIYVAPKSLLVNIRYAQRPELADDNRRSAWKLVVWGSFLLTFIVVGAIAVLMWILKGN